MCNSWSSGCYSCSPCWSIHVAWQIPIIRETPLQTTSETYSAVVPFWKIPPQLKHLFKWDNHSVTDWMDAVKYSTLKSGLICSTPLELGVKMSLNWASVIQLNGVVMWNAPAPSHTPACIYSTQVIPYQKLERYFHPSLGYTVQIQSLGVGGQGLGSANNGGVLFWRWKVATIYVRGRRGQIMWTAEEEARLWLRTRQRISQECRSQ